MKNLRRLLCAVLIPAVLSASQSPAIAAVIPHDLDQTAAAVSAPPAPALQGRAAAKLEKAGLSSDEASRRAQSMDRTEMARLEEADLRQKGGDPLGTVLVVLAIVALTVWIVRNI